MDYLLKVLGGVKEASLRRPKNLFAKRFLGISKNLLTFEKGMDERIIFVGIRVLF